MDLASKKFIGEHDFRNFCKMDAANVHNYKRQITSFEISSCNQRSKVSLYAHFRVLGLINASIYILYTDSFFAFWVIFFPITSICLAMNIIRPKYYANIELFSNFLQELVGF